MQNYFKFSGFMDLLNNKFAPNLLINLKNLFKFQIFKQTLN